MLKRLAHPHWLCQQILAKKGERGLHELKGLITAPTLRPDGTLLNTPGFDQETGLRLRNGEWPTVPEEPTEQEVEAAFDIVWKPFAEFPFVGNDDRGVMLAAILTAVVRATLPGAPAFSFDAPVAGTGKTLLAQCLQRICGSPPCIIPECRDEEELRKRLLAKLREGKPSVLFDNIRGSFGSAALEGFLTCPTYSDRLLGQSQILALPTNVLVLISGNNFQPKGDLHRRIMTARIDAKTDAPERRNFDLDPLEHCRRHRHKIVAAALTILRGFVVAGKPSTSKDRLASFEAWDDLVRQAVLWLGKKEHLNLGDPTCCIEAAKEQEPERQKLTAFLSTVATCKGTKEWRVADLLDLISRYEPDLLKPTADDLAVAALRDALHEIASDRGKINPRILGRWIERQKDIRCGGYFLKRCGTRHRAVLWKLDTYGEQSKPDGK